MSGSTGSYRPISVFAAFFLVAATLLLLPSQGTDDVHAYWLPWMHNLDTLGPVRGFAASVGDYPPGTSLVLFVTSRLGHAFGIDEFYALKTSLLVFLCASTATIWFWTRDVRITAWVHGALVWHTLAYGYLDIYMAPWLCGALWAIASGRITVAGTAFAIAASMKWQPLVLAPFIVAWLVQGDRGLSWPRVVPVLRFFAPLVALGIGTYAVYGAALSEALWVATHHPWLSGNALNFPWVITHWLHVYRPGVFGGLAGGQAEFITTRSLWYTLLPRALFAVAYLAALTLSAVRAASFVGFLRWSLVGYLAYFTFNTGVHENHLFVAVLLAAAIAWRQPGEFPTLVAVTLMNAINVALFYGTDGSGYHASRLLFGLDAALIVACANTAFFVALFWQIVERRPST